MGSLVSVGETLILPVVDIVESKRMENYQNVVRVYSR